MNISPKSVKASEHWKDWFSDAFHIYKQSLVTSSAIFIVGALSIFLMDKMFYLMAGPTALITTSIVLIISSPLFFYYFICLFIKYDKNSGGLSSSYSKSGIKSCLLFFAIASIIMATFKMGSYINPPENTDVYINLFEINFAQFSNSFSTFKISAFFPVIMLLIFMGFNVGDSIRIFLDGWHKNSLIFFSSAIFLPVMVKTLGNLPYCYLFLPFVIPYMLCVLYVVFKHIFMDIEPRKRVKRKISVPTFAS